MFDLNDAIIYLENRDLDKAKEVFNLAILKGDSISVAHAGLANCYARDDNLVLAKRELDESVKTGGLSLLSCVAYGIIADKEGRDKEAEDYFFQATKIDPKSSYAHLMLGSFLLAHSRNEQAIGFLLQAKEISGNNWVVNRNLTLAYIQTGKHTKAFREAILSFISRPSKQGFELLLGCFLRTYRIILVIVIGVCLSFFYFAQGTIQGIAVPVIALVIYEGARYIVEKNKGNLLLILLYFIFGLAYYFIFVK